MTVVTATTINRTPFREVKDIPAHLLSSDKLKWESSVGNVALTSDGARYAHIRDDGSSGYWWATGSGVFRPVDMTWETAEALVSPQPPPAQQPKTEEPFRPGLPPAELRAVCKEWEWSAGVDEPEPVDFVGDCHRFLNNARGERKSPSELAAAYNWGVGKKDFFRPLGRTWADVEAAAIAVSSSSHLPKDGDKITVASAVAVVKEGCRQALDELLPSYETLGTLPKTRPVFTVITSLPRGRRKYVKIFLKSLGFRNVDKIPTTTEQKPYYMSLLSTENREKLISLAPGIVLRDVL